MRLCARIGSQIGVSGKKFIILNKISDFNWAQLRTGQNRIKTENISENLDTRDTLVNDNPGQYAE